MVLKVPGKTTNTVKDRKQFALLIDKQCNK
jgi:hypothetical protein